jgi:hypothetical protein
LTWYGPTLFGRSNERRDFRVAISVDFQVRAKVKFLKEISKKKKKLTRLYKCRTKNGSAERFQV